MKKNSNILRYTILMVVFIVFTILLDKLFGEPVKRNIWKHICEGGVFLLAVLFNDIAEKSGWDTSWSGLINKFKKNKQE